MSAERGDPSHGAHRDTDRLLDGLTGPQREAVTHTEGPMLVLAGAGSGKTRVITRRAAYLVSTVTDPQHVLAITFTNKAAGEMRERIASLGVGPRMTVCTFHSLCARWLRQYHAQAGLAPNFTIVDQSDRRKLVKRAIEQAELSAENWKPAVVEGEIGRAKNAMEPPDAMSARASGFFEETVARIYRVYEQVLAEAQSVDFDDLLLKAAHLISEHPSVRSELVDRYRYVLIDEYQDTNTAQYRIARLLTNDTRNLFVTGDPDQSIYGWRGADMRNIMSFEQDYPDARVVRLEQNYRSTKRILSAAHALIRENVRRKDKTLWTENDEGCPVRVIVCADGVSEANAVVEDLALQAADGRPLRDCAVFYRVNALSRTIEEACVKAGIHYRIARGLAFYARKEIKDVLAYLRVMVNPADSISLERILSVPPRGIGKVTIDRLKALAAASGCTLYEAVRRARQGGLNPRALGRLSAFTELLDGLGPLVEERPRRALEQTLSLSGLTAMLNERRHDDPDAVANVEELISAAADFERANPEANLLDWLTFTSLVSDEDVIQDGGGAVTLMTLHAAKGLEFPAVYIIGVEEGLLPFRRSGEGHPSDQEEERRLFFVGMTRAKQRLTILCARRRTLRGASLPATRSPFLDELPRNEIEWVDRDGASRTERSYAPVGELPEDAELWEVGTLVRHPAYGLGQITGIRRGARRTHVDVRFEDGTDRDWVLEFACLKRVDFDEVD